MISSRSPFVSGISGRNITILVGDYIEPTSILFNVSDGEATIAGVIPIVLEPVDDPPVILNIIGKQLPGLLSFDLLEGQQAWLDVEVLDVDSEVLSYDAWSNLDGVEMLSNGTLHVLPSRGDVGTFWAVITVDDLDGGPAETNITLEVANVNDPPAAPKILSPANGTVFEGGAPITFNVEFSDPDAVFGQVLTIVWRSNLSGVLAEFTSENATSFTRNDLVSGRYLIMITVSDGEQAQSASIAFYVKAKSALYNNDSDHKNNNNMLICLIGLGIAIIVLLLSIFLYTWLRMRR